MKATVATSLACQGIAARHGENVMIADTALSFAGSTISLLRDSDACQQLGASGRKTVESLYDWDVIGGKLTKKYEDLAAL